jgi:hypothetical protein
MWLTVETVEDIDNHDFNSEFPETKLQFKEAGADLDQGQVQLSYPATD